MLKKEMDVLVFRYLNIIVSFEAINPLFFSLFFPLHDFLKK
jgi:hypothetical protein